MIWDPNHELMNFGKLEVFMDANLVTWYKIVMYEIRLVEWLILQDTANWKHVDRDSDNFIYWVHESLYTMMLLRTQ